MVPSCPPLNLNYHPQTTSANLLILWSSFSEILCKWNHIEHMLLCLPSFIHPCLHSMLIRCLMVAKWQLQFHPPCSGDISPLVKKATAFPKPHYQPQQTSIFFLNYVFWFSVTARTLGKWVFNFSDLIVQVAVKKIDEKRSRLGQLYLPQFLLPLTMSLKFFSFN